ncbi:MAG: dTDP-glucose 4,6-dehydratase, partial [Candidatus Sericytochromatia bacterium]
AWTESVDERPGQDKAYVISSHKARSELGWSDSIDLESGLQQVLAWIDRYWDQIQSQPLHYLHKP